MTYYVIPNIVQNLQNILPEPAGEIELHDEHGNRIQATVITVIESDVSSTEVDRHITPEGTNNSFSTEKPSNSFLVDNHDVTEERIKDELNNEQEEFFSTYGTENFNDQNDCTNTVIDDSTARMYNIEDFVLCERNSISRPNNDDSNSKLSFNENSNSSEGNNELQATSRLQECFPLPAFTNRKGKNSLNNCTTVAVVDELLNVLQQKEVEKKERGQQTLLNKRERAKIIRKRETAIVKQYNENKKKKLLRKKELKSRIQNLKTSVKSENSKENVAALNDPLQKLSQLENSIIKEEVPFLQTKVKIKEEKIDITV
ncbi:hypothetical protein TSAR_014220 [Trichomalopsis sarcophagae]|uniref:Uncharacterized protein n=1 Tax=Trichomalopsis sarcophagae TaxID=543379 RepID=A0A232FL92_9HYME|nr:hypothetical protein TSAR_014220 [Trichomalopsis sarcophagae]